MALPDSQSRKSMAIWAALVLAAVLMVAVSVYAVTRPAPPTGPPQPAVVVSYGLSPPRFGLSCGGVAVVRFKNGEVVRAASFQHVGFQSGTLVTVIKYRSTCPPARYTVLHGGPPNSSFKRTPAQRSRSDRGAVAGAAYLKR